MPNTDIPFEPLTSSQPFTNTLIKITKKLLDEAKMSFDCDEEYKIDEFDKHKLAHRWFYENPIPIRCKLNHPGAKLPTKANSSDLGWDICCVPDSEWFRGKETVFVLNPGCTKIFSTGLHIAIPECYGFLLWPRSGLAAKNKLDRMAGAIDSSYRGEWKVVLTNHGYEPHTFHVGDKIVQAILVPILQAKVEQVDELPESKRGTGGFGSTGR